MPSSPIPAARCHYLLDLLAQVPDPRKRRGRRHPLAGLLAVGVAAVIAGSRSFAAIGQWAADAGPEALAALGAARGPAEESTFRRAFALVSADALDRVLGAWLWTRAVLAGGRLVIAIDGKTVRGAKSKEGKAPHLVAALAHGIGAVLGQVAAPRPRTWSWPTRPRPLRPGGAMCTARSDLVLPWVGTSLMTSSAASSASGTLAFRVPLRATAAPGAGNPGPPQQRGPPRPTCSRLPSTGFADLPGKSRAGSG